MSPQVDVIPNADYAADAVTNGDAATFGYHTVTIIPKSDFPSINFRTYQAYLIDPYGNLEQGFSSTLKARIQSIDKGVFAVDGAFGTSDNTYGFNTIVNINSDYLSIPSLTRIICSLGKRSASPFVLASGVEAIVGNDGTLQAKGAIMYPVFFRPVNGSAPDNAWATLLDSINEYKRGVNGTGAVGDANDNNNFIPGEYIAFSVQFMTGGALNKR